MISRIFNRAVQCVFIALFAVFVTGCAGSRGGPIPYDVQGFGAPDVPKPTALPADYRVAVGDTLTITVFQAETLSHDYVVDGAGNVAMPLIGSTPVVGLTPDQASVAIGQRLAQKYMQNPNVTVAVKESVNRNVTVEGSVRQPGVYPVTGRITLIQAVALARGTDERANPKRVAIFRQVEGQRMAAAFDLVSIRRGQSQDPEVYAGDIVVVDGGNVSNILRDVLTTLPVLALFRPY